MTDFYGRFSMTWGSNGQPAPPSDAQCAQGFTYLGQTPPSAQMHDALFQWLDQKDSYLYTQISSVFTINGVAISESSPAALGPLLQQIYAPLASPALSGTPTTPNPPTGSNDKTIPNTSFVSSAITAAVNAEAIRAEGVEGTKAPINSPAFTGTPTAPTPADSDASGRVPNTGWVESAIQKGWPLLQLKQANGFVTLPGGIILQWGYTQSASGGTTTINLPIAFPNGPFVAFAMEENVPGTGPGTSWYGNGGAGTPTVHGLVSFSKTQVTFYSMVWTLAAPGSSSGTWEGATGDGFNWLVIGF